MKIGLSGHRIFQSEKDELWVRKELSRIISDVSVDVGITSLAIGADQLFASILLENKIPHHAVIPCLNYHKSFTSKKDLDTYQSLYEQSKFKLILPLNDPTKKAYLEAGKKVVDMSDLMLFVWDGKKAKGLGGTGDIVEYAIKEKKKIMHLNTFDHKVYLL